jgi:hypothetical protein
VALSLLFAGAVLGGAAALLLGLLNEPPLAALPSPVLRSVMCSDPTAVDTVSTAEMRLSRTLNGWRFADGRPVNELRLAVRLAALRQLKMTVLKGAVRSRFELREEALVLGSGDARCSIAIGAINGLDNTRALEVFDGVERFLGRVPAASFAATFLEVDPLIASRPLYLAQSAVTAVQVRPEVTVDGAEAFSMTRRSARWWVDPVGSEPFEADAQAASSLLEMILSGIEGRLVSEPPELTEPDLTVGLEGAGEAARTTLAFFSHDSGHFVRRGADVFRLNRDPIPDLSPRTDALRRLAMVDYDRSKVDRFEIGVGGATLRFQRVRQANGSDHWMRAERVLEEGFRLSALLYDLHTLRADRYLSVGGQAKKCDEPCRRVVAFGAGEVLVDLRLWPDGEGWTGQVDDGPTYSLGAQRIEHWPFSEVK